MLGLEEPRFVLLNKFVLLRALVHFTIAVYYKYLFILYAFSGQKVSQDKTSMAYSVFFFVVKPISNM